MKVKFTFLLLSDVLITVLLNISVKNLSNPGSC